MKVNNPAARLYLLLDAVRKKNKQIALQHAWAEVLGFNQGDLETYVLRMAEIVQLTEEIKSLIAKEEVDQSLYFKPFIKIQRLFSLAAGNTVEQALPFLDDGTMTGLEHCAELLARKFPEKEIEAETLKTVEAEVDALKERIIASTLDNALKMVILDSILDIQKAIGNYRIYGSRGVEKTIQNTMGAMQYFYLSGNQNVTLQVQAENDKKAIADYIDLLEKLLSIFTNLQLQLPLLTAVIGARLLGQ